ncbi:hypothetical protein BCT65_016340 [Vibrio splendidus]|uniref:hypothetical protein n=1 Tax=Vibrio splendidus TaxID=29497 RepID=UPI0010559E2D|nr:hypothetical protein [Vibrio splendidus]MCC5518612.1 hypothetical protein [Vibrio splendidus]
MALSKSIGTLGNQVSASIDSNNRVINESRVLIDQVNSLILAQEVQRKDILDVMVQAKDIKESKADLTLSIASDVMAIKWNFWTAVIVALGSLLVTIIVLTWTLKNETKKQNAALAIETDKQTEALNRDLVETRALNNAQIDTQLEIARQQNSSFTEEIEAKISISNDQLKTQLDSVKAQTNEAHLLKIDEFRQAWINTFREDISVLFKSFIALKDFHSVEEGFFIAWDILKRAERRQRNVYDELVKLANQEAVLEEKVRAKLKINFDEGYLDSLEYTSSAKAQFEQYKNEFREFNSLHATIIEQKTKIILMFNPDGTPDEKNIVQKLNYIHNLLSLNDRTFMPQGNKEAIDKALIELQPVVQDMLKTEWNRVKRVEPF